MELKFTEKQKFTQWWLWLILILAALIPVFGIFKKIILGENSGNNSMSNLWLVITAQIIFLLLLLVYSLQLNTKIDNNGIQVRFFPIVTKSWHWNEIMNAKVINYGFVGGWGVRFFTKYGTVYNIKGNKGLAIELRNGKKFLVGTQKEAEMNEIIKKFDMGS